MPKLSEQKRKQLRHEHRLYPFKPNTKFRNLLARRQKYYAAWRQWLDENQDILEDGEDADAETLSYFRFIYKKHARHAKAATNTDIIYERIAKLLLMLDRSDGLAHGQEVFYRYMSDQNHSNLAVKCTTLKRSLMQAIKGCHELKKLVGNKD